MAGGVSASAACQYVLCTPNELKRLFLTLVPECRTEAGKAGHSWTAVRMPKQLPGEVDFALPKLGRARGM